jgi:methylated-DNA-[protein]-cysteine S-methyltransferase
MITYSSTVDTPVGPFTIVATDEAVLASGWTGDVRELLSFVRPLPEPQPRADLGPITKAALAYHDGDLAAIDEIPVDPRTGGWRLDRGGAKRRRGKTSPDEPVRRASAGERQPAEPVRRASAGERQPAEPFLPAAWQALRAIPPGEPISYTELAARAGRPAAVRAAAQACARNPCALFVPCHRVVRMDGSLGGFRWGLPVKRWLLRWESSPSLVRR